MLFPAGPDRSRECWRSHRAGFVSRVQAEIAPEALLASSSVITTERTELREAVRQMRRDGEEKVKREREEVRVGRGRAADFGRGSALTA